MRINLVNLLFAMSVTAISMVSCASRKNEQTTESVSGESDAVESVSFNADSAYYYVDMQMAYGARVPNTDAHRKVGAMLESELRRHGAEVETCNMDLQAFDGTVLKSTNILGKFNPKAGKRLLLLAHWDSRPWADQDSDESKHNKPVPGANDGASGVGLLLEIARLLGSVPSDKGVDILFVDAEDYGAEDNEDSWALGTEFFVTSSLKKGYIPSEVIVVDMVGGEGAVFCKEYFSQQADPVLLDRIWHEAERAGYGSYFQNTPGGAITDDHIQFIKQGIPAIDIVDFKPDSGFPKTWHTTDDTMEHIDRATLKAVGQTLTNYIYNNKNDK
jgi:hypothetical protein